MLGIGIEIVVPRKRRIVIICMHIIVIKNIIIIIIMTIKIIMTIIIIIIVVVGIIKNNLNSTPDLQQEPSVQHRKQNVDVVKQTPRSFRATTSFLGEPMSCRLEGTAANGDQASCPVMMCPFILPFLKTLLSCCRRGAFSVVDTRICREPNSCPTVICSFMLPFLQALLSCCRECR